MIITQAITAGTWFEYYEPGDFFRILTDSASTTFDVEFYSAGKEIVDAASVKAGYSERFIGGGFDRIKIRATVNSTVQFVIRLGNIVGYDIAPTGSVLVNGITNKATFTHSISNVANVATLIKAAMEGRKYLLIQNRDDVGNIWVKLDGFFSSMSFGVKVGPGESLELADACPSVSIYAIGDIASNPNVLVVEA